jgi:hypothetical protein
VRYGGGNAWQVIDRVALITDVIGSSNLTSEEGKRSTCPSSISKGTSSVLDGHHTKFNSTIVRRRPGNQGQRGGIRGSPTSSLFVTPQRQRATHRFHPDGRHREARFLSRRTLSTVLRRPD